MHRHHALLATCSATLHPELSSVALDYDGTNLYILPSENRFNDILDDAGFFNVRQSPHIALLIGEIAEEEVGDPHGIKLLGQAIKVSHSGSNVLMVTPEIKWSWGINQPAYVDGELVIEKTSIF